MRVPVGCELWIDGVRVADGLTGADHKAPIALDNLSIPWGRSTTVDQPEPSTCSVTLLDRGAGAVRVDSLVSLGSRLAVWAVLGADRRVVFAGRVTDLEIDYDDGAGGAVCDIVAADLMADLANRYVGSEPWVAETLSARAGRIMAAVGALTSSVVVDARPGALPVSRMDVDRQSAQTLLRDLATTGSAAVWVIVSAAAPTAPTLRIEDPTARTSMWILAKGTDNLYRPMPSPTAGDPLDACAVLQNPVKWLRSTSDLITRTTVRWLDQTTTPGTTERSVGITDTTAEQTFGARGLSVGTILSTEASATTAAQLLMASHQPSEAWRADGLIWDLNNSVADDATTRALALNLLDNAARIGRAIRVAPLPWWTPNAGSAGLYVDGGTYRFVGGRWVLALRTTSGIGAGGSMTYAQSPRSIRYQDVGPDVSYLDLIGVAPPPAGQITKTWADQPADERFPHVEPASHTNAYGFPVPDITDPYPNTPAAIKALGDAVSPKLGNSRIRFIDMRTINHDASGDAVVDLTAMFSSIDGVVALCSGPAAYEPVLYQWVKLAGEYNTGRLRLRALKIQGADGTVLASNVTKPSMIVWGQIR